MKRAGNVISAFKRLHKRLRQNMTLEITRSTLITELIRETEYNPETIEKWLPILSDLGYIKQIGIGTGIYKVCWHPDLAGQFDDPFQQELEIIENE